MLPPDLAAALDGLPDDSPLRRELAYAVSERVLFLRKSYIRPTPELVLLLALLRHQVTITGMSDVPAQPTAAALRKRRSRQRQRGEDIPLLPRGRPRKM